MLQLTWSSELTWPEPPDKVVNWPEGLYSGMNKRECDAWLEQAKARYSFGFSNLRDAQNNAARGNMDAIYAVHVFKVFLFAECFR